MYMAKTRKSVPWKGWSKLAPSTHQRTVMLKNCGKKCFLGKKKKYPICKKNTCKISKKGVWAAYVRSREMHKRSISTKAKKLIRKMSRKKRSSKKRSSKKRSSKKRSSRRTRSSRRRRH